MTLHSSHPGNQRPQPRAARRAPDGMPPPQLPGTVVRSHPRRTAIAAWWRHRPNPVAAATLLLIATYLGRMLWAAWSAPWTAHQSLTALLCTIPTVYFTAVALSYIRRWHRRP